MSGIARPPQHLLHQRAEHSTGLRAPDQAWPQDERAGGKSHLLDFEFGPPVERLAAGKGAHRGNANEPRDSDRASRIKKHGGAAHIARVNLAPGGRCKIVGAMHERSGAGENLRRNAIAEVERNRLSALDRGRIGRTRQLPHPPPFLAEAIANAAPEPTARAGHDTRPLRTLSFGIHQLRIMQKRSRRCDARWPSPKG